MESMTNPPPFYKDNDAMNLIYRETGVTNSKVCHHRSAAMQYAGFHLLGPHQSNTLTKHKLEKHHAAYGPVAERKTCTVMSEFKDNEPYHLERGQVELPRPISWYEVQLFGDKISNWRAQAGSDDGDKSTCCSNFLNEIIPWFVEVLVHDGIFFIDDFRDHGFQTGSTTTFQTMSPGQDKQGR